jgi:hypothetical protein
MLQLPKPVQLIPKPSPDQFSLNTTFATNSFKRGKQSSCQERMKENERGNSRKDLISWRLIVHVGRRLFRAAARFVRSIASKQESDRLMSANANSDVLFPTAKWSWYPRVLKLAKLSGRPDDFVSGNSCRRNVVFRWCDRTAFDR